MVTGREVVLLALQHTNPFLPTSPWGGVMLYDLYHHR